MCVCGVWGGGGGGGGKGIEVQILLYNRRIPPQKLGESVFTGLDWTGLDFDLIIFLS